MSMDVCKACGQRMDDDWNPMAEGELCPDCFLVREVVDDCKGCNVVGIHPSHNGSKSCKSGSIASGGFRAHCTCDTCF